MRAPGRGAAPGGGAPGAAPSRPPARGGPPDGFPFPDGLPWVDVRREPARYGSDAWDGARRDGTAAERLELPRHLADPRRAGRDGGAGIWAGRALDRGARPQGGRRAPADGRAGWTGGAVYTGRGPVCGTIMRRAGGPETCAAGAWRCAEAAVGAAGVCGGAAGTASWTGGAETGAQYRLDDCNWRLRRDLDWGGWRK